MFSSCQSLVSRYNEQSHKNVYFELDSQVHDDDHHQSDDDA